MTFRPENALAHRGQAQAWILALVLLAQLAAYLPHVGRGFVTDDYIWLSESVRDGRIDLPRTFSVTTGFFRPLVSLSFGLQFLSQGTDPRPYGLFNLLLHLLNIILVFLLLRSWDNTKPLAPWGAALFALNVKAAEMAVGWISGRCELLFSFFLLLALLMLRDGKKENPVFFKIARWTLGAVFYLAALLSKETAVAAPIFVFFFAVLNSRSGSSPEGFAKKILGGLRALPPWIAALMVYFILRFQSNAFTPANSPAYYRFSFSPLTLLKNVWEYLTRAASLDILVLAIILGLYWFKRGRGESGSRATDRAVFTAGLFWFFSFLLPCLFLEARSDLYAYLPQLGVHMVFLAWLAGRARPQEELSLGGGWPRGLARGLCLLLVGWSVLIGHQAHARARQARASALFCSQLAAAAQGLPAGKRLLLVDAHFGEKTAPSRVVGYGVDAMLQLRVPGKNLRGEFTSLEKARLLRGKDLKNSVAFIWQNGEVRRIRLGRKKKSGKPIGLMF